MHLLTANGVDSFFISDFTEYSVTLIDGMVSGSIDPGKTPDWVKPGSDEGMKSRPLFDSLET